MSTLHKWPRTSCRIPLISNSMGLVNCRLDMAAGKGHLLSHVTWPQKVAWSTWKGLNLRRFRNSENNLHVVGAKKNPSYDHPLSWMRRREKMLSQDLHFMRLDDFFPSRWNGGCALLNECFICFHVRGDLKVWGWIFSWRHSSPH